MNELRAALRGLRKQPGFSSIVIVTLALGIGINTAIFSVAHGVLWRPLPFQEPDRLVFLWHRTEVGGMQRARISAPDVAQFRNEARLFDGFAFTNNVLDAALTAGDVTEHARLGVVTSNFFDVLGARPLVGRAFLPDEGVIPAAPNDPTAPVPPTALVLNHDLWRSRFGEDPAVIGSTVRINGRPALVVGVMPPAFEVPMPTGVGLARDVAGWTPIRVGLDRFRRSEGLTDRDTDNTGAVIARMRPSVTLPQAQAEMDGIAARQRNAIAGYRERGVRIEVAPLHQDAVADSRQLLLALLGGAGCVLLVACLNIANLNLARGSGRRREMAVRSALGANRARLARQLVMESVGLAVLGAAAGFVLAAWAVPVLLRLAPADLPLSASLGVDLTALVFTTGLTAVAVLVSGALPAVAGSRERGEEALRAHGVVDVLPGVGSHRRGLVVAEIALSMAVLVGGGLMLRTLLGLRREDPGFQATGAVTFQLSLRAPDGYTGPAERAAFLHRLATELRGLPEVHAVGVVAGLPLSGEVWTQPYGLQGETPYQWAAREADFRAVTSGYFHALGAKLLAGRTFTTDEDLAEERRVVVVDALMARRLAPDGSPVLGRALSFPLDGRPVTAEIVGVVQHVRHEHLERDGREAIYVPYRQEASRDVSVVVRTSGDATALLDAARRGLAALDPRLPAYAFRTLSDYVNSALAPTRFALTLLGGFGVLALALACLGLYGLLAFTVGRRRHEFGIRLALGARPGDVMRAVLVEGGALSAAGVGLGLVLAVAIGRSLSELLFGVGPLDALTYGAIAALLTVAALSACYVPARRAARVDPMEALRHE
jgi:predicted permease